MYAPVKRILLGIWDVGEAAFIALISILIIYKFVAHPFLVQGASMEPTFRHNNYLLVDEISYRFTEPERGEVIVFRAPKDRSTFYIKRIIGLPNDTVVITSEGVAVNGELIEEEMYLPQGTVTRDYAEGEFILGDGQYFVMGDNRDASYDSRRWGPIARPDIIGKVSMRLWPVTGRPLPR